MKNKKALQFVILGLLSVVFVVILEQQVFAQNNIPNISGQWTYRAAYFANDGNGCITGRREGESMITINQNGNQFTSSGGMSYGGGRDPVITNAMGQGTIENNQIQSRVQFSHGYEISMSWSGTIERDGNTISGNVACMARGTENSRPVSFEGSTKFTLTRRSPSNQNQPNNTTPATPQPNSSQTPSNSQAPPFPLDAGPNTIRPDFR